MALQTYTYEEDEQKKKCYLERLRAYTAMQLKPNIDVDKWLSLQLEIEAIQYHIQSIEYRLRNREQPVYKNHFDTKRTQLI